MATIAIFLTQYFADAAGFTLKADGTLTRNGEHILSADVRNGRISNRSHYDVLDVIARETPDRATLSVRYAQSIDINALGTLGLAIKAAVDLKSVLQRYVRYYSLISDSTRPHLHAKDDAMLFQLDHPGATGAGVVFSAEAGLSALFASMRQVAARPIPPIEVLFQHDPARDASVFDSFFGCKIRYGQQANGILFDTKVLDTPNRLGDSALSNFLEKHLDQEIEDLEKSPSLVRSTKQEIARMLSEGPPNMSRIAQGLGFSARSFHRRLSEHGVSFQTLAEETRREIALGMLGDGENTLSEIAFLTGFSEQSSFNRAFKRWTGQTPARYRKELGAQ
ncbi:MAG: AraC family transcriptional regulator [Rhodobacteraceae bacterium]|nr:AraC family transcriptional regulator [Paracoccaceae bacterium]